jgi:GNAT superfamily N-acetyltransferase
MTGIDRYHIRRAEASEAGALSEILASAFMADPVSCWIFPDPEQRARLHPGFFRIFVDLVLAEGQAYTTDDHAGVAMWLDVDATEPATEPVTDPGGDPNALRALFAAACEDRAEQFFILDDLFTSAHPHQESHAYLAFVGVLPHRQGQGVGGALVRSRLDRLDEAGRPAYLEASSPRNAALYERLGFAHMGLPLTLPEGPSLYPMWRKPFG